VFGCSLFIKPPKKKVYIASKQIKMQHIIDRFISYVTIDTESDASSETTPSTKKTMGLAHKLVENLKQ
jgi:tripeptide aminopeptidase